MGPFVGQLHSQTYPGTLSTPTVALEALVSFIDRSRRAVRVTRIVVGVLGAVGLAWLASRVDAPVGIGLCGLAVIAPVLWLATGLGIPLVMLGRNAALRGEGLVLRTGAAVTFDEAGLVAAEHRFSWSCVTNNSTVRGSLTVRGIDPERRRVFQVVMGPSNFASQAACAEAAAWIEQRRTNRPTP